MKVKDALNIPRCTGLTPPQRRTWARMSVAQRQRNPEGFKIFIVIIFNTHVIAKEKTDYQRDQND